MVTLANIVVRAAAMRTESRGPHYRLDYRFRNDRDWLKNILVVKGKDGAMNFETKPVAFLYDKPDYSIQDDFGLEVRR
jgi:succinate dehydrogenase/fumarate reductase flavoprotein subunit